MDGHLIIFSIMLFCGHGLKCPKPLHVSDIRIRFWRSIN